MSLWIFVQLSRDNELNTCEMDIYSSCESYIYCQVSNIRCTSVGNKIVHLLRCSWSIPFRRCSNYIFILDLTPGFNRLCKDNCKPRQETFNFLYSVHLILEVWLYACKTKKLRLILSLATLLYRRRDQCIVMTFSTCVWHKESMSWHEIHIDNDLIYLCGNSGVILGLCPANERRRYFVTTSPIGWAQA